MLQVTLASHGGVPIWWLEKQTLTDFFRWCDDFSAVLEAVNETMALE